MTKHVSHSYFKVVSSSSHTSNVVGALALALSDRMTEAMSVDVPVSDVAALSALHHILDRSSIEQLRQVLGLTHSGTVRLVDRLVEAGAVRRTAGPDRRTASVTLTDVGKDLAARATAARAAVLEPALAALDAEDRESLDRLAGAVLVRLMRGPGATRWICRLCDTKACGRYTDECPLGREASRRPENSEET